MLVLAAEAKLRRRRLGLVARRFTVSPARLGRSQPNRRPEVHLDHACPPCTTTDRVPSPAVTSSCRPVKIHVELAPPLGAAAFPIILYKSSSRRVKLHHACAWNGFGQESGWFWFITLAPGSTLAADPVRVPASRPARTAARSNLTTPRR